MKVKEREVKMFDGKIIKEQNNEDVLENKVHARELHEDEEQNLEINNVPKHLEELEGTSGDSHDNLKFTTLAPTVLKGKEFNENQIYITALEQAIKIDENRNIALMGSYGSGKSSILKTFEARNPENEYLFLSLASFIEKENEEIAEDGKGVRVNSKIESWEKIENILVKQMIYKKTAEELPYSSFKRIVGVPDKVVKDNAIAAVLLISLVIVFNYGLKLLSGSGVLESILTSTLLTIIISAILLLIVGLILWLTIHFIKILFSYGNRLLKLSRLSFKSFTIESDSDDTSYFSKYLDEIIYFFEVSKTNIVVIEDVDRFDSVIIFEHLRELNYLLNNSSQIDQSVKFIYAVRDDLFNHEGDSNLKESEEYLRTKFFDFIIPVIPVVDYKNSRDFLVPKIREIIDGHFKEDEISFDINFKRYLWGISIYLDDLRLINNMTNELEVYLHKLPHINTTEKLKKLFALIVYKNIYPADFSALQRNNGNLYDVFTSIKKNILNNKMNELDDIIQEHKNRIESGSLEVITNTRLAIMNLILEQSGNIGATQIGQVNYFPDPERAISYKSIMPLSDAVINDFLQVKKSMQMRISESTINITKEELHENFSKFGVQVDKTIKLLEDNEIKERKESIKKLEEEKMFLDTLSIKEILEKGYDINSEIVSVFPEHKMLVKHLLTEGLIYEEYFLYISNNYEGTMNVNDLNITQKLRSNTSLGKDDKIDDFEAVLFELSESDYRKQSILNAEIILYIFNNAEHYTKRNDIILTFIYQIDLSTKVELLSQLLKAHIEETNSFISQMLKTKPNIYSKLSANIDSKSDFIDELAYRIFSLNDVKLLQIIIAEDSRLKSKVESISGFVPKLYDEYLEDEEELNDFFAANNFKFKDLGIKDLSDANMQFFINEHLYLINPKNVIDIYTVATGKSVHYFSISELLNSEMDGLINHINGKFEEYLSLLNNKETLYESGDVLLQILNESEITEEQKVHIIKNNSYQIKDVTEIDSDIDRLNVFRYNKYDVNLHNIMKANWEELKFTLPYFNESTFVKKFVNEALEINESDEESKEYLQRLLIKLVNEYSIEVNEKNIEFFRFRQKYSTEGMNEVTFNTLLKTDRVKATIENINNLEGKSKIVLMNTDIELASKQFNDFYLNDEEIIIGIQLLDNSLLPMIINSSFQNNEIVVNDLEKWLEEVLKRRFALNSSQMDILFTYKEIIRTEIFLKYMEYMIPKDIISDTVLLSVIPLIDPSLENVKQGLAGKKTTDEKYYKLLKALKSRELISSIKFENENVVFYNKLPSKS